MTPLHALGPRPPLGATLGVIPRGWAEHHRQTAEGTMQAPGTVHRVTAGPPPYPKPAGWVGEQQIHAANFRVQALKREGGGVPADQPTVEQQYLLTTALPGCPPLQAGERGDLIRVVGREFRVQRVAGGSELWEMDLICTENLTQQNPV